MVNDIKLLETEGHVAKVKAHMTLLEEEQQQYEDLPNILDDMDIQEGKKVEKTVGKILSNRTLFLIFSTTMKTM
jgi:hypothetical protein